MQPSVCIELVGERGNAEETLVMVGSGTSLSLVEDEHHHVRAETSRSEHDLAFLRLREDGAVEVVLVECKSVRDGQRQLAERQFQVAPAARVELWFDALPTAVRVRPVADTHAVPGYEVLCAVLRAHDDAANQEVSFRAWAEGTMRRGMEEVHAETEQLQRDGLIDAEGRLLVDLPADMRPGSPSDV